MACPPSASITATSTSTRPGSCPARRSRSPASASQNAADNPAASARSANNLDPAWDATPRPSAVTAILGLVVVVRTCEVPLRADDQSLDNPDPTAQSRHLSLARRPVKHLGVPVRSLFVVAGNCGPQPVSRPRPEAAPEGLGLATGEDRDMLVGDEEGVCVAQ